MGHEDVPIAFFSYCREDSEFALKLAADLKVAGAHVWIDQLDIEPGTPWDRAVEDALTNSPRMLVVLSPVSVNSDNVRDEVSFALSRQKRVIPVLYRDCEVPFRLARLQHIDFRPNYERALTILIRALGVGQAPHAQMPLSIASAAKVESAVATSEAEENAREKKLEDDRRLADEQAQLEQARAYAAEQARLKRERQAAAEQAEQQRAEEDRARSEQTRREQRAAEQARLEQEARLAAERVRLAQAEKDRREAEIKARQEQLRREEQESVERKSISLEDEAQASIDVGALRTAPAQPASFPTSNVEAARCAVTARPAVAPARRTPASVPPSVAKIPSPQPQGTGLNLTSPKLLGGGAVLLAVLGLIVFFLVRPAGPEKKTAGEYKAGESTVAQQAQPAPQAKQSLEPPSSSSQTSAAPASTPAPDESLGKTKPVIPDKDVPKAVDNRQINTAIAASTVSNPNRVRITQNVARALLMHEIAPTYPPLARSAHVQGQVVLEVVIARDGSVKEIKAKSGHPMLVPAAIDAVKKWSYQPYKLNGKPVEAITEVVVNFTLTT